MPSPEQSRPSIDDAQQKLESLDGAHDGRFAQGDTLKQTYIDRVNDVQARIRQLRTQADTMKSAKSKGWEELETACQAQEQKLYDTLKAIVSPEQLHKQQQIVEEKINEALRKLSEIHPETSTEATDAHVQLETAMDALHIAVKDVQTIEDSIRSTIALLANDARDYKSQWIQDSKSEGIIRQRIARIGTLQASLKQSQERLIHIGTEATGGDIAVLHADAKASLSRGDTEIGQRMLLKIWDKYSASVDLQEVNPELWKEIGEALSTLRTQGKLSEFEKKFYSQEFPPEEALQTAVREQQKINQKIDFVDQVHSDTKLSIESYKEPAWGIDNMPKKTDGELKNIITPSGATIKGVLLTPRAMAKFMKCPASMTVVLRRIPQSFVLTPPKNKSYAEAGIGGVLGLRKTAFHIESHDTVTEDDIVYASVDKGMLTVQSKEGFGLEKTSISKMAKDRDERTHDVLRCIDRDPAITSVMASAAGIHRGCQTVQTLFAGGSEGGKYEQFIEFSRTGANDLLKLLTDPQTLQNAVVAKQKLEALKKVDLGIAHGGLEVELNKRIESLDRFIAVLNDQLLRSAIDTMRDASKWSSDTWNNWIKKEGPQIFAAIAGAVLVTTSIILSGGTATPLWVMAAASAGGGMAGAEIMKEVQHYYKQYESDVLEGRATYKERSRIGAYGAGQKVRDAKTGEERNLSLVNDVISPYTQEFVTNFSSTLLTMGASQVAGGAISTFLNNGRVLQTLSKHGPTLSKLITRMQRLEQASGQEKAKTMREFMKRLGTELPEKLQEETSEEVIEEATSRFLKAVEFGLTEAEDGLGLGDAGAFIVGTIQNIRLRKPGVMSYQVKAGIDTKRAMIDLRTKLENNNYNVQIDHTNPHVLLVSSKAGKEAYRIEPETVPNADSGERKGQMPENEKLALQETIDSEWDQHNFDGSNDSTFDEIDDSFDHESLPIDHSRIDTNFMFSPDIAQSTTGNCYLIASFNSLYHNPQFNEIMETSIRITDNGYEVSFPLGSTSPKETITVTHEDIGILEGGIRQENINQVKGLHGWGVLEAAYLKKKTGGMDRQKMEGGYGHEALIEMFGDTATPITGLLNGGIQMGRTHDLIPAEMSDQEVKEHIREHVYAFFDAFDPKNSIVTINSIRTPSGSDQEYYSVKTQNGTYDIYNNHAYSIESVDKQKKIVCIKNPHDTSVPLYCTYDECIEHFADVSGVTLSDTHNSPHQETFPENTFDITQKSVHPQMTVGEMLGLPKDASTAEITQKLHDVGFDLDFATQSQLIENNKQWQQKVLRAHQTSPLTPSTTLDTIPSIAG